MRRTLKAGKAFRELSIIIYCNYDGQLPAMHLEFIYKIHPVVAARSSVYCLNSTAEIRVPVHIANI